MRNIQKYTFQFIRRRVISLQYLTTADSELEELGEQLPRYRPDSIAALRRATRFTEPELKRLYRGFKAECPTGVVREETFKLIYSQFFPQGGKLHNISKKYIACTNIGKFGIYFRVLFIFLLRLLRFRSYKPKMKTLQFVMSVCHSHFTWSLLYILLDLYCYTPSPQKPLENFQSK